MKEITQKVRNITESETRQKQKLPVILESNNKIN